MKLIQLALLTALPAFAGTCGIERQAVKVLSDSAAKSIGYHPVPATILSLSSIAAPVKPVGRVKPTEFQVFLVEATITGFKLEGDQDFHVVISDGQNTMIIEFPDPSCIPDSSPIKAKAIAARAKFIAHFGLPTPKMKRVKAKVRVTGVFFYDRIHGQTGVAPNGCELHPCLSIDFI